MSKYYFLPLFIILGLLGNILNLEMFFGVNQIFGSIFVLLAVWYYGAKLGVLTALIVSSYTIILWGHPYAFISFVLEALVVALLLRYKVKNIFVADFIYWLFLGIWLVPIFYGAVLELSSVQVWLIMLKQFTNGILNALIATLISLYIIEKFKQNQTISFKEIIFTIMVTIVTFTLYLSAIMVTKQSFKGMEQGIVTDLKDMGGYFEMEYRDLLLSKMQEPLDINEQESQEESKCENIPYSVFEENGLGVFYNTQDRCIKKLISKEQLEQFLEKKAFISGVDILILKDDQVQISTKDFVLSTLSGERNFIDERLFHLLPNDQMAKMALWKKSHYIYLVQSEFSKDYNIAIAISLAPTIEALQMVYIYIFVALLLIISISGFIIYFSSELILKSLKQLGKKASDLPIKVINNETISWPQTNIEEINNLTNNFKTLTKSLRDIFKENDQRYKKFFEASNEAIIVVELEQNSIVESNFVAKDIFGIHKLKNSHLKEIYENYEELLTSHQLKDIYFLKDFREQEIVCKIGVQFFYLHGKEVAVLSISDISDQIKLEEQLKLIAKVYETTQEGIVVTDKDQKIIIINQGYMDITGYGEEEVIGNTPKLLHSGYQEESFYEDMWEKIKTQDTWEGEIWNKRKDGSLYAQWLRIHKLLDQFGEVQNYIGIFLDITERKNYQEKIDKLAFYDCLTELPNRALFEDRIEHAILNANRSKRDVALMFIDLDNFKTINDTLGHAVGDRLLQEVSQRIKSTVRDSDTLSRIGGDEFTLILENINGKQDVRVIVNKIKNILSDPIVLDANVCQTSASIGICLYPEDAKDITQMMQRADIAMYKVKERGRNGFEFFDKSML